MNLFISYCQALAKSSLIHEIQHGRLNLDQTLSSQNQLDDFAIDCIADLFARDSAGNLFLIRRYFEPKMADLDETPQSAIILLRKLIASRVHQSLISLFSQVDQGGWKIWRNLSLVSKRNPYIHEFSYLSNSYYYYDESDIPRLVPDSLNPDGAILPDALLSEWLQVNLKEYYGLPQAILGVLKHLGTESEYRQFLEKARLFYTLKQHLNVTYIDIEEIESLGSWEPLKGDNKSASDPQNLIIQLDKYISIELLSKYIDKGKISSELSKDYFKILQIYFSDLIADGYVEKLQKYLSLTGNDHLLNDEWLLHRGRLEYMIKLGKAWLREQIKSDEISTHSKMRVYNNI
ncbi:MAG: hypothetical protein HOD43_00435 [Candidatus Marinimicrobia bacterium]|jgi:hypothetical protein|nr:hypothetical protein [Candidatus Neomarinimicrobiota bacterium]MBT3630809.1 hypothetical protein [Candidatus Neomarinimicrobiota bacterium]MBT3823471.1 hypothetical protein [Candidatus Neomarinimicrobiota bacterium]MBT4130445.1 hypothetical protein [Candidatus Neomarinimicrobiota bacterium]MBT4294254.1 hypothetical protein [Candidatus Neomarinimicrobiota bacterium]